jgi:flagellar biosynthesis/type III secretory pathway chaperone
MSTASRLADVLGREADVYESLLEVLQHEEAALIAGDARRVGDCMTRTESLVLELRLLETSRATLVTQLTGRADTPLRDLPGATGAPLAPARERLGATLSRVQRTSRRVTALLDRSLQLFDATLELIRDAAGLTRHYTPAGVLARVSAPTIDGRA